MIEAAPNMPHGTGCPDHDTSRQQNVDELKQTNIVLRQKIGVLEQVTEQQSQELATLHDEKRRIEETYRMLIEHTMQGLIIYQNERLVFINSAAAKISGYTVDELLGKSLHELRTIIHPDDRDMVIKRGKDYLNGKPVPPSHAFRIIHRDGDIRWLETYVSLIHYHEHNALHMSLLDITERVHTEEALRESEERYRLMADNVTDMIARHSPNGIYLYASPACQAMLGYSPEELIGQDCYVFAHPDDVALIQESHTAILNTKQTSTVSYRIRCKEGTYIWLETTGKAIYEPQTGSTIEIITVSRDITSRKEMEEALRKSNEQFIGWVRELEQHNREVRLINEMSDFLQSCLTVEEAYKVIGRFASRLFAGQDGALYIQNDTQTVSEAVAIWGSLPSRDWIFSPDACWALRRGQEYVVDDLYIGPRCDHVSIPEPSEPLFQYMCVPLIAHGKTLGILHLRNDATISNHTSKCWVQLAEMVSKNLALALANLHLRERLQHQSMHDPLTGLYNRRYMAETLERELRRAEIQAHPIGLVMLDIDHFKMFNDTYGHDGGDTLLHALGAFLQTHMRSDDIACRYGGEEFTLILPNMSREEARQYAEALRAEIKQLAVQHNDIDLGTITVSMGIASFPESGINAETLLRAADIALYHAKAEGRDRVFVSENRWPTKNTNTDTLPTAQTIGSGEESIIL